MNGSLWWDQLSDVERAFERPRLDDDLSVDVCIVGGGYTGLWTAFWLQELDPTLSIVVLEAEVVGFGASGRNGGWCSALFPASMDNMQARVGREAARAMQSAMFENLNTMQGIIEAHGIECDWNRGGTVSLIRSAAQRSRAVAEIDYWRSWGFGDSDYSLLGPAEARGILNSPDTLGAVYTPHCARIQPAKLARNLGRLVESRGASILEHTRAERIDKGAVTTGSGTVHATWLVNATEAWESQWNPRDRIPVYSLMVATEPLSEDQLALVGLAGGETFADMRNLIIYGQRTADNRIAFGGRGAPYHLGSKIRQEFDSNKRIHSAIREVLIELLPQLRTVAFTHEWGGPLGIHRDWHPSVTFNHDTGLASAGGYVGDGVASTHLAGQTLAHAITGQQSPLLSLPWVNHENPRWEVEPIRWLGANLGLRAMTIADSEERVTKRPSLAAGLFNRFLGH